MTANRSLISIVIGLVLASLAVWLWMSPSWTLAQMQNAAQSGDMATIDEHVDYDALRADLKTQIATRIRETGGSQAAAVAMALASGAIDTMTTPEAMREMIVGSVSDEGVMKVDDIDITRTGVTEFIAGSKTDSENPGGVVFKLQGVTWRITGIRIPDSN